MIDEEKDVNIPIVHPFTLDKRWSEFNEDKPPGFFSKLQNYIPQNNVLKTRKGIEALTFTPQVTAPTPWDPVVTPEYSADGETALCKLILTFTAVATIGTNAIDSVIVYSALNSPSRSGTATLDASYSKYGGMSLIMDDDTAINTDAGNPAQVYGMRTANLFPQYMPGDSSGTTGVTLITYWIRPTDANVSSNAEWHHTYGNDNSTAKIALGVRHFDTNLQGFAVNSASTLTYQPEIASIIVEDVWQFIAFWCDGPRGQGGLLHYNDATQVITYTTSTTVVPFDHFRTHSSAQTINAKYVWNGIDGRHADGSDAYHGWMDYYTLWDTLFTNNTSNVTLALALKDLHKA